jgi:hypothetical protein
MAIQTKTGKAFEYALLKSFYERLQPLANVSIVQSASYEYAPGRALKSSAPEKKQII